MRCPYCGHLDTQVKDSRPAEDGSSIRRRRQCPACGGRFTTFERVQLRDMMVVKKSGEREPFERDKLLRSLRIALRKRPVTEDQIDQFVSGLVRQLETMGEGDIPSAKIGELVTDALASLDKVAFVRYASVYYDFTNPSDFERFLSDTRLGEEAGGPAKAR